MKKRILLVEDESIIALSQAELLEQHGFEVFTVGSGRGAIDAAADDPDIDLILMDVNLGEGMDGVEAARTILSARNVPILFLTNHTDHACLKRAETVVSYGYIMKNADEALLVASVNMALRLAEAEQRYHRALDGLLEGCQIIDFNFRYVYVNAAAAEHGRTVSEALIGRKMVDAYPEIEKSSLFADIAESMIDRQPRKTENEFFFPDGSSGWFDLRIQPVEEGILILSVETTERKRAELALKERVEERETLLKEKEVLLQELRHRIKNSLNMIGAILYLKESEAKTPDVREALKSAHERIDALALMYRQLNEAGGSSIRLDDYLNSLCESLSAAHEFPTRRMTLAARVAPLSLDLKRGANIGLAITELLTNAIKYAFPPHRMAMANGRIELDVAEDGEDIQIEVRDDGIGLPEDFSVERSDGMGFRLIGELVEQCEGSFMRIPAERGAAFSIRFPR